MKIFVKAKPNSKKDNVREIDSSHFEVQTTSPPREGRANTSVVNALAQHLKIAKRRITMLTGAKSKQKVFEIV